MEIRQLRHFIAAVEAGNLRKASENVHISHPALSMSIKNLETDLGVMLLHKNRRGVQLTYAGEVFLKSAHVILSQLDDVRSQLRGTEDSPSGKVRLGIPFGVNNALAAPLCRILLDRYQGIELEIEEGSSVSLERLMADNHVDLMVGYNVAEKVDQKSERLYVEQLYFVSPSQAGVSNADIEPAELDGVSIASSPGKFSMRRTIDRYAFENDISFDYKIDFHSAHACLKIVQDGIANSIASWDLIHDQVQAGTLNARKIVNPPLERTVCLVSSLRKPLSPAMIALTDAVRAAIKQAVKEDKIRGALLY